MSESKNKRHFSPPMHDANSAFLPAGETSGDSIRVGFVLLEHFSMMAFTAAVDALVRAAPLFSFTTYGLNSPTVKSDLAIDISTNGTLNQLSLEGGLWNGTIFLAHAGLLDNRRCALHPDNHVFMREHFSTVSVACGFLNPTHFSHCFKDYFGVSPSLARQKQRG